MKKSWIKSEVDRGGSRVGVGIVAAVDAVSVGKVAVTGAVVTWLAISDE